MAEQGTHKPLVGGSSPPLATHMHHIWWLHAEKGAFSLPLAGGEKCFMAANTQKKTRDYASTPSPEVYLKSTYRKAVGLYLRLFAGY